jgi:serine/threonine-protein kinase
MAQVMIARAINQQDVSRLVALKRILPALAHDQAIVKQFFDEAKIGMRLSHQNLVTTFDFGQAHGNFFITMELVAGVDFDEVMRWPQGPLPPELISAVMTQALEGIHAAHEMTSDDGLPWNLVHRDLSPQNLKIGFNGRVKVLDFGVAKTRTATTVTLPGIVKGKPLYMSPEQATAEAIDRRSDVFSMGLILFEALAQERAFDKREDTKTMVSIVNDPLRRHPRIPNTWWAIVEKALHKQPHLRFQTAAEMAEAIRSTVAPMTDHELASVITTAFPQRHAETVTWGRYLRPTSVQKGPSDER